MDSCSVTYLPTAGNILKGQNMGLCTCCPYCRLCPPVGRGRLAGEESPLCQFGRTEGHLPSVAGSSAGATVAPYRQIGGQVCQSTLSYSK